MADQCPKCGYAMDPFDETCKRCSNLKALPQQPSLLREKQQADQIQRNLAGSMKPMYPPRTQPPNWIPRGQTAGHWVGSGSSTGEDSWVWVDGNGRQVGPTYFSRPAQ